MVLHFFLRDGPMLANLVNGATEAHLNRALNSVALVSTATKAGTITKRSSFFEQCIYFVVW